MPMYAKSSSRIGFNYCDLQLCISSPNRSLRPVRYSNNTLSSRSGGRDHRSNHGFTENLRKLKSNNKKTAQNFTLRRFFLCFVVANCNRYEVRRLRTHSNYAVTNSIFIIPSEII
jgi:hypothetical protein